MFDLFKLIKKLLKDIFSVNPDKYQDYDNYNIFSYFKVYILIFVFVILSYISFKSITLAQQVIALELKNASLIHEIDNQIKNSECKKK